MSARNLIRKNIAYLFVVAIIIFVLAATIYGGIWPPFSVVESESMEHGSSWEPGVINTGDIVLLKKVNDPLNNIVTYVDGRSIGFKTYGEYGDVILYNAPDGEIIIHRAMFYLTWDNGNPVVYGYHGQSWIKVTKEYVIIYNCSYNGRNLFVSLKGMENESGFITVGDHNLATSKEFLSQYDAYIAADQNIFGFPPVPPSKVVAVAYGQIPWLGLIKLNIMRLYGEWPYYNEVPKNAYTYLLSLIASIIIIPYASINIYKKIKKKVKV